MIHEVLGDRPQKQPFKYKLERMISRLDGMVASDPDVSYLQHKVRRLAERCELIEAEYSRMGPDIRRQVNQMGRLTSFDEAESQFQETLDSIIETVTHDCLRQRDSMQCTSTQTI